MELVYAGVFMMGFLFAYYLRGLDLDLERKRNQELTQRLFYKERLPNEFKPKREPNMTVTEPKKLQFPDLFEARKDPNN